MKTVEDLRKFISQQFKVSKTERPTPINSLAGIDEQIKEHRKGGNVVGQIYFLDRSGETLEVKGFPYKVETGELITREEYKLLKEGE